MRLSHCFLASLTVWNALLLLGESFVLRQQPYFRRQQGVVGTSNPARFHNNPLFLSQRGGGGGGGGDGGGEVQEERTTAAKNNIIEVSSHMELPFSAEIAFDAFSDLPRQASWSPWLKSVKYTKEGSNETKWTMRSILGVSYSWNAISTKLERPYLIEWESLKGLRNWGRVEFHPKSVNATAMQLTLTFVAPRIVARFFQNHDGGLSKMVQKRIVGRTLRNFCKVVLEEDVPKKSEQMKERDLVPMGPPRERYQSIVKDRP